MPFLACLLLCELVIIWMTACCYWGMRTTPVSLIVILYYLWSPLPVPVSYLWKFMQGNTAVYLLYAHARICSIIRKSGKDTGELKKVSIQFSWKLSHCSCYCCISVFIRHVDIFFFLSVTWQPMINAHLESVTRLILEATCCNHFWSWVFRRY